MTTCDECGRFVIPIEDGQAPEVCKECNLLHRLTGAAIAYGAMDKLVMRDLLLDARDTVERLRSEQDEEVERHDAFSGAVQDALAPVAYGYLRLPDGGSVGEAEMATRLIADLRSREAAVAELEAQLHATDVARLEALAEIERLTRDLELERRIWCDQPDDRLYHASDGTWWRRNGRGECVSAEPPAVIERLQARVRELEALTLDATANRVSGALPAFSEVNIAIEHGGAWVTLERDGHYVPLPDSVDRTLVEQIDAALTAANAETEEA